MPSIMPGINVVPLSTIVRAPAGTVIDAAGPAASMRSPRTTTTHPRCIRLAVEHAIGLEQTIACGAAAAPWAAARRASDDCDASECQE